MTLRSSPAPTDDSTAPLGEPAGEQYDENGVDLTLVRYTLSLSPTQRLKAVENYMKAMASVKPVLPRPGTK